MRKIRGNLPVYTFAHKICGIIEKKYGRNERATIFADEAKTAKMAGDSKMQGNQGTSAAGMQNFQHRLAELQEQAAKDALSGLLNRATAEQHIARHLESMAAADITGFSVSPSPSLQAGHP